MDDGRTEIAFSRDVKAEEEHEEPQDIKYYSQRKQILETDPTMNDRWRKVIKNFVEMCRFKIKLDIIELFMKLSSTTDLSCSAICKINITIAAIFTIVFHKITSKNMKVKGC